ncbi:MAG: glycosyltransferase family 2 protein [Synechococcaceae cyanobacterium ELA445]
MRRHKPHELAVLAIFKNEAHVLREWVNHYAAEGATTIHLVNNNSTDDYQSALQPHTSNNLVVVHQDSRLHSQKLIYNEQLQRLRSQCNWLLVCDLDEFIYARCAHQRIIDYLRTLAPWVSSVQIPWKMFGSSGHLLQPAAGVRAGFTKRADADQPHPCMPEAGLIQAKIVARCSRIRSLDVHRCNLLWGLRILPNGKPARRGDFQPIGESQLNKSTLHLNHYAIQSESLFRSVKMLRGDVNSPGYTRARDMSYFQRYDTNERTDRELALKSSQP